MTVLLVVVHSFEGYEIGDVISDEADMVDIASGEHGNRAVRILFPASTEDQTEDN